MTVLQTNYDQALHEEIRALAEERNAVILAHNYERPEIQDVAHFVGDSLGLSREAAHPGAVVVAYVNTTAEVKAESDYCCTSGNAVEIVESIPEEREILFLPDMFLGAHVRRVTGRRNIHVWMGECHVHAGIDPEHINLQRAAHPHAEFLIHPECGCATPVVEAISAGAIDPADGHILSTEGMIKRPGESAANEFIVATELGILHRL